MTQVQYVPPMNDEHLGHGDERLPPQVLHQVRSQASSTSWIHAWVVGVPDQEEDDAGEPSSSAAHAIDAAGLGEHRSELGNGSVSSAGRTRPGSLTRACTSGRRIAPVPTSSALSSPAMTRPTPDPADDVERVVGADVDAGDAVQHDEHPRHPLPATREDRRQQARRPR